MITKSRPLILFFLTLALAPFLQAAPFNKSIKISDFGSEFKNIRVGTYTPENAIADALFINGFVDNFETHEPLFEELAKNGIRTIAFDGGTEFQNKGELSISALAALTGLIDDENQDQGFHRPLILIGYSLGGLVAEQIVQRNGYPIARSIKALVLLNPALSLKGLGTEYTKTSENTPSSPELVNLLWSAYSSRNKIHPSDLPTLVVLGGDDEDLVIKSSTVKYWVKKQRAKNEALILGVQCEKGSHEMDKQGSEQGPAVRQTISSFAASVHNYQLGLFKNVSPCQGF